MFIAAMIAHVNVRTWGALLIEYSLQLMQTFMSHDMTAPRLFERGLSRVTGRAEPAYLITITSGNVLDLYWIPIC